MVAASKPTFKKCVIAYWSRSSAPIMNGTKLLTEAVDRVICGRRAWRGRLKWVGRRPMDEAPVIMPERVTLKRVRIPFAENPRIPGEGHSAQV